MQGYFQMPWYWHASISYKGSIVIKGSRLPADPLHLTLTPPDCDHSEQNIDICVTDTVSHIIDLNKYWLFYDNNICMVQAKLSEREVVQNFKNCECGIVTWSSSEIS